MYSGGLTASFTVATFESSVESLFNLLDAAKEGVMHPLVLEPGNAYVTMLNGTYLDISTARGIAEGVFPIENLTFLSAKGSKSI